MSAGSGSLLVCVCSDILTQLSGLRLVSVLLSSCAALCLVKHLIKQVVAACSSESWSGCFKCFNIPWRVFRLLCIFG